MANNIENVMTTPSVTEFVDALNAILSGAQKYSFANGAKLYVAPDATDDNKPKVFVDSVNGKTYKLLGAAELAANNTMYLLSDGGVYSGAFIIHNKEYVQTHMADLHILGTYTDAAEVTNLKAMAADIDFDKFFDFSITSGSVNFDASSSTWREGAMLPRRPDRKFHTASGDATTGFTLCVQPDMTANQFGEYGVGFGKPYWYAPSNGEHDTLLTPQFELYEDDVLPRSAIVAVDPTTVYPDAAVGDAYPLTVPTVMNANCKNPVEVPMWTPRALLGYLGVVCDVTLYAVNEFPNDATGANVYHTLSAAKIAWTTARGSDASVKITGKAISQGMYPDNCLVVNAAGTGWATRVNSENGSSETLYGVDGTWLEAVDANKVKVFTTADEAIQATTALWDGDTGHVHAVPVLVSVNTTGDGVTLFNSSVATSTQALYATKSACASACAAYAASANAHHDSTFTPALVFKENITTDGTPPALWHYCLVKTADGWNVESCMSTTTTQYILKSDNYSSWYWDGSSYTGDVKNAYAYTTLAEAQAAANNISHWSAPYTPIEKTITVAANPSVTANAAMYPFDVADLADVQQGLNFTVFLLNDGTVYTCGANNRGQLGAGADKSKELLQVSPKHLDLVGFTAVDVVKGGQTWIALSADGLLYGCGANTFGQLGQGNLNDCPVLTPIADQVERAWLFPGNLLVRKYDGSVYGCGYNLDDRFNLGRHYKCIATLTRLNAN